MWQAGLVPGAPGGGGLGHRHGDCLEETQVFRGGQQFVCGPAYLKRRRLVPHCAAFQSLSSLQTILQHAGAPPAPQVTAQVSALSQHNHHYLYHWKTNFEALNQIYNYASNTWTGPQSSLSLHHHTGRCARADGRDTTEPGAGASQWVH